MNYTRLLQRRLTADKREIKDFLKFAKRTSFIRKTLYAISCPRNFGGEK